jgi:putative FmdB family regulatory protein
MPMYDFECKACGHAFETIARVDEKPPCPSCQSADTERLMGAPMITGKAGVHYTLPRDHKKSGLK